MVKKNLSGKSGELGNLTGGLYILNVTVIQLPGFFGKIKFFPKKFPLKKTGFSSFSILP